MSVGKHDPWDQAQQEDVLRLTASERGLQLVKFRRVDDPRRSYSLVDQESKIVAVSKGSHFLLSLDDVADYLSPNRDLS